MGSATEWAWAKSQARNGALIVLLAIADEIDGKGTAEMSVAELARKTRLSDRAVQLATRDLAAGGELAIDARVADAARNRYRLPLLDHGRTGEESAPVKNLHPEESSPVRPVATVDDHVSEPRKSQVTESEPLDHGRTGEESAPSEIRDVLDLGSVVSGESQDQEHSSAKRPRRAPGPERPGVSRVCDHLADRLAEWKTQRPKVTQEWRDSARLMIDSGISEQRIIAAIDWAQSGWWRTRIASMPKLREKFDVLREQAAEEQRKKTQPTQRANPDDEYAAAMQRIVKRKENANGTRGDSDNRPAGQVSLPPAAN
ncbi:MAG TPA: hypothetical protein VH478_04305 [Trebonia sp.]|nr:hypothetical protein [Trebonia sp.]